MSAAEYDTITRQVFHLLGAFGHVAAAIRLGEARQTSHPDDPETAYILAALRGDPLERAPDAYVTAFFDGFADKFDAQLVDVLGYRGYAELVALVDAESADPARDLPRVLDLGCGTGLAGPLLARPGRRLVGLDLSPRMLDRARERGCYDELVAAEALAYLVGHEAAFDLVFAADVLLYIGDLADVLRRVAAALAPGGLFALTLETSAEADVVLLPSGRFAHRPEAVLRAAEAAGFAVRARRTLAMRYETNGFVEGALIVLCRP